MRKSALIVANWNYEDSLLRGLVAPSQDAESLAAVLRDKAIGGFEVQILANAPSYRICEETEAFFGDRERDDLLLYYFTGHGVTDEDGQLYYAASNTFHKRLLSTAVAAAWVNEIMNRCRSRRQVLLLDCCHSGAFARAKAGTGAANVGKYFTGASPEAGRGKFILTASDAFQYSFEGDAVEGKGMRSVFTEALVEGLQSGAADLNRDGQITLDELYDFVYTRVREKAASQTPRKWASDVEGEVVIALNPHPVEAPLPEELQDAIDHFVAATREVAVSRLDRLLRGKHRGHSLAAHRALLALADDDNLRVSSAARKCLAAWTSDALTPETRNQEFQAQAARDQEQAPAKIRTEPIAPAHSDAQIQQEQARLAANQAESLRMANEANDHAAREQAERDRLAAQKAEAKRLAKKTADRLAKERAATEAKIKEKKKAAAEAAETDRRAKERAANRLAKERAEAGIGAREQAAAEAAETDRRARAKTAAEQADTTRLSMLDFRTILPVPLSPEEKAEIERRRYELGESIRQSKAARLEKERTPWPPGPAQRADSVVQSVEDGSMDQGKKQTGWSPKAAPGAGGSAQPAASGSVKVGGRWVAPADSPKLTLWTKVWMWFMFLGIILGLALLFYHFVPSF